MRIALDTNVLVYAETADDPVRKRRAGGIIAAISSDHLVVPLQVAAELYRVLVWRKVVKLGRAETIVQGWLSVAERPGRSTGFS